MTEDPTLADLKRLWWSRIDAETKRRRGPSVQTYAKCSVYYNGQLLAEIDPTSFTFRP